MRTHALTPTVRFATSIFLMFLTLLACRISGEPARGDVLSADQTVIFFDDFLGESLDSTKWTVLDRLSDQANHEVNCVISKNVSVKDGLLEGVSKYEDHSCGDTLEAPRTMHYTSWQIQQATKPFLYGTIEVRAKGARWCRDMAGDLDVRL